MKLRCAIIWLFLAEISALQSGNKEANSVQSGNSGVVVSSSTTRNNEQNPASNSEEIAEKIVRNVRNITSRENEGKQGKHYFFRENSVNCFHLKNASGMLD